MMSGRQIDDFRTFLSGFRPLEHAAPRSLATCSAAITISDISLIGGAIDKCRSHDVNSTQLYEAMLQSYLFLGFPRMLVAAECLNSAVTDALPNQDVARVGAGDFEDWTGRGTELCKKVYGSNYRMLKDRVESMAPEIFQWMILEGYGKVLSRPGLDSVRREISTGSVVVPG